MTDSGGKRNHSVMLDENECKGCTICVTTCPTEAIRVRNGKAHILEERCIDCGECIRRCPNHAKKARVSEIGLLKNPGGKKFDYYIALPAPSLYGQYSPDYSIEDIHRALKSLGFDAVFSVASVTSSIARATLDLLDKKNEADFPRPLISSSCPTIIKFIQIRFPTLLSHIAPVIAPMELASRLARKKAEAEFPGKSVGIFFISPCAGKITEALFPMGGEKSSTDGVISMSDIHLQMLSSLSRQGTAISAENPTGEEMAWGRAGGEADATVAGSSCVYLAVDGMDQCAKILETVEDGKLGGIDYLELMACTEGCVGGPLAPENPALARFTLLQRELKARKKTGSCITAQDTLESEDCMRENEFPAKSALLLDGDYTKALQMMDTMETIFAELPGLDCGCCGSPNCHALAEDIVRGKASKTDCVIILKEQYRTLLESGKKSVK